MVDHVEFDNEVLNDFYRKKKERPDICYFRSRCKNTMFFFYVR